MKQRKKYPAARIETTNNPKKKQDFYETTDADAPLDEHQFVAGMAQHPDTGLFQTWVSTNGLDITFLCAHRDKVRAEKACQELKAFLGSQAVFEDGAYERLFGRLKDSGDGDPQPLPDAMIRQITRAILRRVAHRPQQAE